MACRVKAYRSMPVKNGFAKFNSKTTVQTALRLYITVWQDEDIFILLYLVTENSEDFVIMSQVLLLLLGCCVKGQGRLKRHVCFLNAVSYLLFLQFAFLHIDILDFLFLYGVLVLYYYNFIVYDIFYSLGCRNRSSKIFLLSFRLFLFHI